MKLLKVNLLDNTGRIGSIFWFNPEKVVGVLGVLVPGDVAGPTGAPVSKERAGIDFGTKVIVVDESLENMVKLLKDTDK